MEFESLRASALARRSATIVPPPAPLAPTASGASATVPLASVIQPATVIPPASVSQPLASVIQPVSVIQPASVSQPLASVIQPVSVTPPVAPPVRLVPISATQSHPQAENGQVGGSKTPKRIEFNETECRRVFRNALLCKTFTPQDE